MEKVEWQGAKKMQAWVDFNSEKFIDKYNDFIQYFNTHIISFWRF